jgi:hypothetical protein
MLLALLLVCWRLKHVPAVRRVRRAVLCALLRCTEAAERLLAAADEGSETHAGQG